MIPRLLALGCAVVAAAGCGGDTEPSATRERTAPPVTTVQRETWETVVATLKPGLDAGSSNPCQSGRPRCLDLVLGEMERRATLLASTCDHDALFAALSVRTTDAIARAVDEGRFANPAAVTHFAAWFAPFYFNAFDSWHAGDTAVVALAWRRTFEAADRSTVTSLGDLLLAMNAHITADLPFVVADVVRDADAEFADFALVSRVIEEESNRAVDDLANRFDADLVGAELPLVLGGRPTLGAVVAVWRLEAWQRGLALADASDYDRPAVAAQIEAEAGARADLILPSLLYPPLLAGPERRDAYCATQRTGN